jgi:hypothetical protein
VVAAAESQSVLYHRYQKITAAVAILSSPILNSPVVHEKANLSGATCSLVKQQFQLDKVLVSMVGVSSWSQHCAVVAGID